jgi:hypothetical protein
MMERFEGVRNTCAECGAVLVGGVAWADSADAARAGMGLCEACVAGPPEPDPVPRRRRAPKKKAAVEVEE